MVSVGGRTYGRVTEEKGFQGADEANEARRRGDEHGRQVTDFFRVLGLAHTVSRNPQGELEAESPDELTLVEAAEKCGWNFKSRESTGSGDVLVIEKDGRE